MYIRYDDIGCVKFHRTAAGFKVFDLELMSIFCIIQEKVNNKVNFSQVLKKMNIIFYLNISSPKILKLKLLMRKNI